MLIELVGGPRAGHKVEIETPTDKVLITEVVRKKELIWAGDDEPYPGYIDSFGNWAFGNKPEYLAHWYARGEDGRYYYTRQPP